MFMCASVQREAYPGAMLRAWQCRSPRGGYRPSHTADMTATQGQRAREGAITAVRITGRQVKILWLCALTGFVISTAYTRINTVVDQLRGAQLELRASPSYRVSLPNGGPRAALEEDAAMSGLSIYMQLHETRDADMSQLPPAANACSGALH
jgi:hypothetical protein